MYQVAASFLLTLPVLIALDLSWLGFLMRDFYQSRLGHLLGPINWGAAVAFYLVFTIGMYYFAVLPAHAKHSLAAAALAGALYGFFTYATYDLTNMATLKAWPLSITLIDIAWGVFIGAALASAGYLLLAFFSR